MKSGVIRLIDKDIKQAKECRAAGAAIAIAKAKSLGYVMSASSLIEDQPSRSHDLYLPFLLAGCRATLKLVVWHAYTRTLGVGTPPMTEAAASLQDRALALLGLVDGPVILVGRGTPVGSTSYRPETRENFASLGHIVDRIARPGADEWLNILAVEHEGKNLDRALIWTLADMWHAEGRS